MASNTITFCSESNNPGPYKKIYEIAYSGSERVQNKKGIFLSRIPKKNGKARYYLTQEDSIPYCEGCAREYCSSRSCRGAYYYEYTYRSKYVGKDLELAMDALAKCDLIALPQSEYSPESEKLQVSQIEDVEYIEW